MAEPDDDSHESTAVPPTSSETREEKIARFSETIDFVLSPEWLPWFEHHRPDLMARLRKHTRAMVERQEAELDPLAGLSGSTEPAQNAEPAQPTIYMVALLTEPAEPAGDLRTRIHAEHGYFATREDGESVLEELNAGFKTLHEARDAERLATAQRQHRMVLDAVAFEDADFLPRFVLIEIHPHLAQASSREAATP